MPLVRLTREAVEGIASLLAPAGDSEELNLQSNEIQVLENLAPLSRTRVRRINLSHNRIRTISGLVPLLHLQELDLSYNRIGTVAVGLPFPRLCSIDLSHNCISSIACTIPDTVERIALQSNAITNIESLEPVLRLHSLRHLDLRDNPLVIKYTEHASLLKLLLQHLPGLESYNGEEVRSLRAHISEALPLQNPCISTAVLALQSSPQNHLDAAQPDYMRVLNSKFTQTDARISQADTFARTLFYKEAYDKAKLEGDSLKAELGSLNVLVASLKDELHELRTRTAVDDTAARSSRLCPIPDAAPSTAEQQVAFLRLQLKVCEDIIDAHEKKSLVGFPSPTTIADSEAPLVVYRRRLFQALFDKRQAEHAIEKRISECKAEADAQRVKVEEVATVLFHAEKKLRLQDLKLQERETRMADLSVAAQHDASARARMAQELSKLVLFLNEQLYKSGGVFTLSGDRSDQAIFSSLDRLHARLVHIEEKTRTATARINALTLRNALLEEDLDEAQDKYKSQLIAAENALERVGALNAKVAALEASLEVATATPLSCSHPVLSAAAVQTSSVRSAPSANVSTETDAHAVSYRAVQTSVLGAAACSADSAYPMCTVSRSMAPATIGGILSYAETVVPQKRPAPRTSCAQPATDIVDPLAAEWRQPHTDFFDCPEVLSLPQHAHYEPSVMLLSTVQRGPQSPPRAAPDARDTLRVLDILSHLDL